MTSKHNPIIKKLNPETGFDVRTNHGEEHPGAGYSPERKPDDYLASKIRKATAEVELNGIDNWSKLAPSIAKQPFESDSNYNALRRSDNMRTTSQVAMNLDKGEFALYVFPNECTYHGLVDDTPDDYQPKIKFKLVMVSINKLLSNQSLSEINFRTCQTYKILVLILLLFSSNSF